MSLWAFLMLGNALLIAWLAWRVQALSRASRLLASEVAALREAPHDAAPDLSRLAGQGRPVIVIDILNALELAARESWFARHFGSLAPQAIRQLVFDRALNITRQELLKHGVEAQLSLHRGH